MVHSLREEQRARSRKINSKGPRTGNRRRGGGNLLHLSSLQQQSSPTPALGTGTAHPPGSKKGPAQPSHFSFSCRKSSIFFSFGGKGRGGGCHPATESISLKCFFWIASVPILGGRALSCQDMSLRRGPFQPLGWAFSSLGQGLPTLRILPRPTSLPSGSLKHLGGRGESNGSV